MAGADIDNLADHLDEVGYSVVVNSPDKQVWSKGDLRVVISPVSEGG